MNIYDGSYVKRPPPYDLRPFGVKAQEQNRMGTRSKANNIILNGGIRHNKWHYSYRLYPTRSVANEDIGPEK
ncbi:hypothetical protein TIFTF001_032662 [Ficus carica]|uniref:Uncharacterized protein n=1 Tax=Ficus carica TaxID=3494 RepID=A0AA88E0P8_FICCA|nr:hypothetical protein TIFTF001_032662 [Ficus carica]